ncbi:MAG TPA: NADPH-dependent FMN reductase [Xanthobacteraceae bacterium]|jgi:chromate reductase
MTAVLNVVAICGSLRKESLNRMLMNATIALAPAGVKIAEAPSWAAIPIYNYDDQNSGGFPDSTTTWADAIRSADGVLIVTPEYNWTIPGGLKNAIDWVSRMKDQPFKDKPVLLQSAAGGILGGSRAQYHLRQALVPLDATCFGRPEVLVTMAAQKFDEKGSLKDQGAIELIRQQLAGFDVFARKLAGK